MTLVSFVKIRNSDIAEAIKLALGLIEYDFKSDVESVVIKPNTCYYNDYTTGQTTDPQFVGALIEVMRKKISPDVKISIVESDASAMKCNHAFSVLGYKELAEKYKVKLVNLSEDSSENYSVKVNGQSFDFPVPKTIQNADLRINVPKIKYMDRIKISSAMKNIFGCNPMPLKYKFHPKLDNTIVALNKLMNFQLHILDGIILVGSFPRRLDLVMASEDPVAFDSAASKLAGENPRRIKYINLAQKEGLGSTEYETKGMNPAVFEKQFPKRKNSAKIRAFAYKQGLKYGLFKE